MKSERLYIVTYDISDQKRWRQVFKTMKGYGEWLQLSVFQCRITQTRRAEMVAKLSNQIHQDEDQVVIVDVGPADGVDIRIESVGIPYTPIERKAMIV